MRKVKAFEHKGRYAIIKKYSQHITAYTIIGALGTAYSLYLLGQSWWILLILPGLISVLYTLPIFGKNRRLRDFSFIKIFLIATVWSLVTESIPLYQLRFDNILITILFIERFLFFIAITLPFDIRDMEVDRSNGVATIPAILGEKKTYQVSILCLFLAMTIEIILLQMGKVSELSCFVMFATYLLTIIAIVWSVGKKDDYYYTGLLDGTMMLPLILWILATAFML